MLLTGLDMESLRRLRSSARQVLSTTGVDTCSRGRPTQPLAHADTGTITLRRVGFCLLATPLNCLATQRAEMCPPTLMETFSSFSIAVHVFLLNENYSPADPDISPKLFRQVSKKPVEFICSKN